MQAIESRHCQWASLRSRTDLLDLRRSPQTETGGPFRKLHRPITRPMRILLTQAAVKDCGDSHQLSSPRMHTLAAPSQGS